MANPPGSSVAVTLTRTADTNAYAANDVIGAATGSTAALEFAKMGQPNSVIQITSCSLEIDATALIASGAIEDTVDKCLWFHQGNSTADKMSVICSRTSANDTDTDKATTVDATYIKLGFVIDGLTSVKWYANGVLVHTSSVAAQIPNAVMCLSFVAQCEGTSKDAEMSIDWVRILQEGTRS